MIAIKISAQTRRTYDEATGINVCWAWTCRQFGNPGRRWQHDTQSTFMFRDEQDALLFALRWS